MSLQRKIWTSVDFILPFLTSFLKKAASRATTLWGIFEVLEAIPTKNEFPVHQGKFSRLSFTNEGTIQRKNYVNQPVFYVKYFSFPELVLQTDEPFRYMRIILCFEFNFSSKNKQKIKKKSKNPAENQKKSKNFAENQKKSKNSRKSKNI